MKKIPCDIHRNDAGEIDSLGYHGGPYYFKSIPADRHTYKDLMRRLSLVPAWKVYASVTAISFAGNVTANLIAAAAASAILWVWQHVV